MTVRTGLQRSDFKLVVPPASSSSSILNPLPASGHEQLHGPELCPGYFLIPVNEDHSAERQVRVMSMPSRVRNGDEITSFLKPHAKFPERQGRRQAQSSAEREHCIQVRAVVSCVVSVAHWCLSG